VVSSSHLPTQCIIDQLHGGAEYVVHPGARLALAAVRQSLHIVLERVDLEGGRGKAAWCRMTTGWRTSKQTMEGTVSWPRSRWPP
jgi:hypothetical protein